MFIEAICGNAVLYCGEFPLIRLLERDNSVDRESFDAVTSHAESSQLSVSLLTDTKDNRFKCPLFFFF